MGTPILPPWAKDHDVAHLQAKTVPMNSIWSKMRRAKDCGISASAEFQEPSSRPWARQLCPHRQMTIPLPMYRPRRFRWTWFGLNRPRGCGVPASSKFQEPLSRPWARPLCRHGQITATGQDGSKELDLGWIGLVVAELRRPQDSTSPYYRFY